MFKNFSEISGIFMWLAMIHWDIRYIYVACHDPLRYPVYLCDVPWSTEISVIFTWRAMIHWDIRYIYVTCHDPLRYPVYLCDVPWSTEISGIFMWRAMIHWDIRYIYVKCHDPHRLSRQSVTRISMCLASANSVGRIVGSIFFYFCMFVFIQINLNILLQSKPRHLSYSATWVKQNLPTPRM